MGNSLPTQFKCATLAPVPVIDIQTPEVQRSLRWQKKQIKSGKCWICADPVTHACMNKKCADYRRLVPEKKCESCGKRTKALRQCQKHIEAERVRRARKAKQNGHW